MGVSLGLIGSGGSILTVPVLVYLFGLNPVLATTYSLFIVGVTSGVGAASHLKKRWVNPKLIVFFGIPSILAVFLSRAYLLPAIPDKIIRIGTFTLSKNILLMLLFALMMISASFSMIKVKTNRKGIDERKSNVLLTITIGFIVGILTGLVGAGGGFLIIPVLVVLNGLSMKEAVGTSLVIIMAKSFIGFLGKNSHLIIDWTFLLQFIVFSIIGVFIGLFLSKKIDGRKLKPVFGWFVLVMGIYIIVKETLLK